MGGKTAATDVGSTSSFGGMGVASVPMPRRAKARTWVERKDMVMGMT